MWPLPGVPPLMRRQRLLPLEHLSTKPVQKILTFSLTIYKVVEFKIHFVKCVLCYDALLAQQSASNAAQLASGVT